jgi:hypothetical protein
MQDLDELLPSPTEMVVGGRAVTIRKLRFGQVPVFSAAVAGWWPLIAEGRWLDAAVQHNEPMRRAVSLLTDADLGWLADLELDQFVALAAEVARVNLDFFDQAAMPAVRRAMTVLSEPGLTTRTH